jgi:hypothetical protein
MYHVAIIGESLGAQVAALACAASGFHDIDRLQGSEHPNEQPQVYSLGANASRLTRSIFMAADQTLPSPITKTRLPRAAAPMITRPMFAIGFITAC